MVDAEFGALSTHKHMIGNWLCTITVSNQMEGQQRS